MRTSLKVLLPVMAAMAISALPADAQIGALKNRVRKAVGEAVAGGREAVGAPAAVAAAAKPAGPVYNDHVLEMTPEVLDRLSAALAAEEADRKDAQRIAASVRTEEGFQKCMEGLATNAEAIRLLKEYGTHVEAYSANSSDPAVREAYQRAQTAITDHAARECGPEPSRFSSQELPKLRQRAVATGREAGRFTESQYSILKERIAPLCAATAGGPGELKIPGKGKDVFWVYSAVEVEGLRARCAALGSALAGSL